MRFGFFMAVVMAGLMGPHHALGQESKASRKVVFGISNPGGLNISWGPLFYAIKMGFLKQEGLEFEQVILGGSTLLPQVANGSVDIGWIGPEPLIISHDVGRDPLPLKFFYNQLRREIYEIVVPENSLVRKLSDLKGATIGVTLANSANVPVTAAAFRSIGFRPGEYSFLPVGIGPTAIQALRSGQVDALNLYDTAHLLVERSGIALRRIDMPQSYTNNFENGLLTNIDHLQNNRAMLIGFARALAKGTVGCYANLPACVKLSWEIDPKLRASNRSDEANMADAVGALEIRRKVLFPSGPDWGRYPPQSWSDRLSGMVESRTIKSTQIDPESLYTNELVPEVNAFDSGAVARQADALH